MERSCLRESGKKGSRRRFGSVRPSIFVSRDFDGQVFPVLREIAARSRIAGMNDAQNTLQELLDNLVRDGRERGVQLVAYLNGQKVVDAFAGNRDPGGHPVMGDTLFPVFSVTKGIAATVLHLLVERGRISYETRIADVWPEFAAAGKDQITLDDALSHLSGVPYMPLDIKPEEVCDWDVMCAAICRLAPIPEPRPRVYHAMTYGWIIGEVARRVDGRTFDRMVHEEICQPLGMEDLYTDHTNLVNSCGFVDCESLEHLEIMEKNQ